jgi:hypothetical protein
MNELINLILRQLREWGKRVKAIEPIEMFLASDFHPKNGPAIIADDAWQYPLDVILQEYFTSSGSTNPVWTIHICLGRNKPPLQTSTEAQEMGDQTEDTSNLLKIKSETVLKVMKKQSKDNKSIEPVIKQERLRIKKQRESTSEKPRHKRSISDMQREEEEEIAYVDMVLEEWDQEQHEVETLGREQSVLDAPAGRTRKKQQHTADGDE